MGSDQLNHNTFTDLPIITYGEHSDADIQDECCICLEAFAVEDSLIKLPCTHLFHVSCISSWLVGHAFCPLCKQVIAETLTDYNTPVTHTVGYSQQHGPGSFQTELYQGSGTTSRQQSGDAVLGHSQQQRICGIEHISRTQHEPSPHQETRVHVDGHAVDRSIRLQSLGSPHLTAPLNTSNQGFEQIE